MIDSHCHLADEAFAGDLEQVVERARGAGLIRALCILSASDASESTAAARLRGLWPGVAFSVGVHPHNAAQFGGRPAEVSRIVEAAMEAESAVAVGEIGLDYHYDFAPRAVQQDVFAAQIDLARRRGRPVVIHTREATEDTFRILREAGKQEIRGVFHCFTGDIAMARGVLDLGFHLGIGGIVTFPRSAELKEVVRFAPPERLLAETDCPYLAPVPYRGKRNEPAWVARVVEEVAALRGAPAGEVAARMVANFDALLGPTVSGETA
jgi:TatD DNase family protein